MFFIIFLLTASVNAEFDSEIHAKYVSLPPEEFVEYFNSLNLTWKIKQPDEEPNHYPCSFIDHNTTYPTVIHDVSALNLPENFDARDKWPQCTSISTIYDQGRCGSCWTFGTATTASDRTCIHAHIMVDLAEQDLSCCTNCFEGNACNGGYPNRAFQFWIDSGLVTFDCMPYDAEALHSISACTRTCVNGQDYNSVKNYGKRLYAVSQSEEQIKAELYKNGPIEATMTVYEDFQSYIGGVYVHKFGRYLGLHSVRIIGYGVENGQDYWLLANSWGTSQGENGFYKIKRNQPDIHIEEYLLTVLPRGS